jgi:hypothetical protein
MKNFKGIKRLVLAMSRCAVVYGEAQWTNGYRAAYHAWAKSRTVDGGRVKAEQDRLHAKEMKQWERVADVDADFERIAKEILTAATSKKTKPRRRYKHSNSQGDSDA